MTTKGKAKEAGDASPRAMKTRASKPHETEEKTPRSSSVELLNLIEELAQFDRIGVTRLSRHLGIPVANAHRMLRVLERTGFVEQLSDSKEYRLTLRLFEIGCQIANRTTMRDVVSVEIERLAQQVGMTTSVGVLVDDYVLYLAKVESDELISLNLRAGSRAPVTCTALGKAMLSIDERGIRAIVGDGPYGLSVVAQQFIAGLVHHAAEITAITNQWVNSYKRLVSGYEAPIHVSWARNNRSALVRVPVVKPGKSESTSIEYRSPDSACNPYLAFAVILAAGLRGIEAGYELAPEADANLFALSPEELDAKGIQHLPGSLHEALGLMESSDLLHETLGEHVFEWFIRNKRAEWAGYKAHVTQFELDRYLPLL